MTILYQKQRIEVEEVERTDGDLKESIYTDTLLRDTEGRYYLEHAYSLKMPLNAEANWSRAMSKISLAGPDSKPQLRRLRAFRKRHEKPQVTVKRITRKTALLWCAHNMFNDAEIKSALRRCISTQLGDVR